MNEDCRDVMAFDEEDWVAEEEQRLPWSMLKSLFQDWELYSD